MGRMLQYLMIGLVVSLYYFSFGLTFLPSSVNTKMLLAVMGLPIAAFHSIRRGSLKIDRSLLGAIGLVVLFSLVCFIAVDYNHTSDTSYATYFVSFTVWIFSAYTVCSLIRAVHSVINLTILTCYLAGACFAQCLLALLIDSTPVFEMFVNRYIDQGQDFLLEVNRLYGIGASLDNAGVRFSLVLIMMAGVLSKEKALRAERRTIIILLIAFFSIVIVGNMMSRTTSIGAGLALLLFTWNTGISRLVIRPDFFKFHVIFWLMLIIALGLTTYFYQSNRIFHEQIRFAFEGFFNWVEIGEWRTDSTDKLSENMWIWPSDLKTWFIGTGLFDNWIYGTDIGYCRFILYCGISGFTLFALFFIYNAIVFAGKYKRYRDMFFLFFIMTFVIWLKVSTDIFIIYALLYCMDMFNSDHLLNYQDENRLLYS
jgi:hypothetical protein